MILHSAEVPTTLPDRNPKTNCVALDARIEVTVPRAWSGKGCRFSENRAPPKIRSATSIQPKMIRSRGEAIFNHLSEKENSHFPAGERCSMISVHQT
jgi:hypothetical protein